MRIMLAAAVCCATGCLGEDPLDSEELMESDEDSLTLSGDVEVSAFPTTPFFSCWDPACLTAFTEGGITWFNRTAGVQGQVVDTADPGSTTAIFEAFAGATKIDTETRTINNDERPFNFTIGDTDLVGGINRIKVTVCINVAGGPFCGTPRHFFRP